MLLDVSDRKAPQCQPHGWRIEIDAGPAPYRGHAPAMPLCDPALDVSARGDQLLAYEAQRDLLPVDLVKPERTALPAGPSWQPHSSGCKR